MARREPVRLPRVRLATAGLPRAAMPAAGWEQARPAKTAGGGGGTSPDPMEAAIMEALVLWYDPRRQGATNESMAADPHLKDLSGNGHDAVCANFAWAGMSGMGGYTDNLFDVSSDDRDGFSSFVSPDTLHITKTVASYLGIGYWKSASMTPRLLLEVDGLGEDIAMYVSQYNADKYGAVRLANGINDVQLDLTGSENPDYPYLTFFFSLQDAAVDITVRILPLYPGAIVSDGVDDMVTATGLPLLEDFTVVAEREFIRFYQFGAIAFKKDYRSNGAFIFEMSYNKNYATQPDESWVFSNLNGGGNNDITPEAGRVSWMTPASYNGQPLSRGELTDKPELRLFYNGSAVYQNCAAALWSFLLFDRTLTAEEIEWVKEHLMGEPK